MRHQLELALHCEHEEKLSKVLDFDFAFLVVACEDEDDLRRLPVELEHDLNEVYEANGVAVLNGLSCTASEEDPFHLRGALVKL